MDQIFVIFVCRRLSCAAIVTPLLMLECEEDDKAYSKGGVEAANKKGGSDQTRLTHGLRKFSFRNLVHKFFRVWELYPGFHVGGFQSLWNKMNSLLSCLI